MIPLCIAWAAVSGVVGLVLGGLLGNVSRENAARDDGECFNEAHYHYRRGLYSQLVGRGKRPSPDELVARDTPRANSKFRNPNSKKGG